MKPSLPKGVRDFTPEQVARREYIFDIIKGVFNRYGYRPIETPAMENLATLTGKYGEEGDRLLFKVLNNGDYLAKADTDALDARDSSALTSSIARRGLRYDLTVPFARFVVQHRNDLAFPFKRYQIQPVWRADRPQKGRYQEFYQCDVDVIGSDSLMYEAELTRIYDEVFTQLELPVTIRLNNRKILRGIADAAGVSGQFVDMTVAIDKLDKVGEDGVRRELEQRSIGTEAQAIILELLNATQLDDLEAAFAESPDGQEGLREMRQIHRYLDREPLHNTVRFDPTLARGLSYYTGCIFEVTADNVKMGSIGGGGRYADLTGMFGLKDMSGVGVSFGAERIYDVLEELGKFPDQAARPLQALFVAFDEASHLYAYDALQQLRRAGIDADLYPEPAKMKKQMKYADKLGAVHVVVVGSDEVASGRLSVKHMASGEQQQLMVSELIAQLTSNVA